MVAAAHMVLWIFGPGRKAGPEKIKKIVVVLLVVNYYQFSKGPRIAKAFLIRIGAQRNFAHTFVLTAVF